MTQWRNSEREDHLERERTRSREERRASIYDDTLSEKKQKSPWVSIAWALLFIGVIGGIVSTVLTDSSKERIAELAEMNRAEKENSPLAQKVREVREQSTTEEDFQPAAPEEPVDSEARTIEETSAKPTENTASKPSAASADPIFPSPSSESSNESPSVESSEVPTPDPSPSPPPDEEDQLDRSAAEPVPPVEETAESQKESSVPTSEEQVEDEAEMQAYRLLLENSAAADQLVSGRLATLQYRDWRVVQKTDEEVWIDLIAEWTTGSSSEVHLIWAVSRENGKVRPLSDAARTLDSAD